LLEWETFPTDGLADGFLIYLVKTENGVAELVAKVKNSSAREYRYIPKSGVTPDAQWHHKVIPYLGEKFLIELTPLEIKDKPTEVEYKKRKEAALKPSDLILSWEAAKDADSYLVRVGLKEYIIKNNYIEISRLQSQIDSADYKIEVFALGKDGELTLLVKMNLGYENYER
jgi:hypothetical protein